MAYLSITFMGSSSFAVPSLQRLAKGKHVIRNIITKPDRSGKSNKLSPTPVKEEALKSGLEVMQPSHAGELLTILEERETDALVNVAYGMILPPEILQLPPLGSINLHPSLLPAYRGAAPIQRALMAGEKLTGVTVLYMIPKLDAGDIIMQKKVLIGDEESYSSLHDRLALEGAICLEDALDILVRGEINRVSQDEGKASYAPSLNKGDEIIDWNRSAREISNKIRALEPSPGAYTIFRKKRLKIFRVRQVENCKEGNEINKATTLATPGTICCLQKDSFHVAANDGLLKILELQPQGKRRMKVEEFLRGNPLKAGEKLG